MTDEELARETLVAEHGVSPRGSMPGPYETSFVRAGREYGEAKVLREVEAWTPHGAAWVAWQAATKAERERAARVAEKTGPFPDDNRDRSPLDSIECWHIENMQKRIAAAIRKRE
jgi:hypothetical protein